MQVGFAKIFCDNNSRGADLWYKSPALGAIWRFGGMEHFYGRVYPPDPAGDGTPFDFSDAAFLKSYMRESAKVGRAKGSLPEYILLARAETGLYQTLHRLKARVHTSAIVRKWL